MQADVVVLGAGMIGLSVAAHLQKRGKQSVHRMIEPDFRRHLPRNLSNPGEADAGAAFRMAAGSMPPNRLRKRSDDGLEIDTSALFSAPRVALVNPRFGSTRDPSMPLGLLQATLARHGISIK